MKTSTTTLRISAAIGIVQKDMPVITADSLNEYLSTTAKKVMFADLTNIWDKLREVLAANGLTILQGIINPVHPTGYSSLQTRIEHSSGEFMEDDGVPLIATKNKHGDVTMQQMGSAITYARRQGLTAMLGVTVAGEDDDAHEATGEALPQREKPTRAPSVKFTGKIKTLAGLKNACGRLSDAIAACETAEALNKLEINPKTVELIDQLKADLPAAWDQRSDDFIGIKQRFEDKMGELENAN